MSNAAGYILLPGPRGGRSQPQAVLIINGTAVPLVPSGSCLVLLTGLIMWSVGMLQARSIIDGIFSDLGLTPDSLTHLKASVLAAVVLLSVLSLLVLAANAWLEGSRLLGSKAGGPLPALQSYVTQSFWLNVSNWVLLLLAALALAGSITWLTTMSTALSATQQTGGYGSYEHNTGSMPGVQAGADMGQAAATATAGLSQPAAAAAATAAAAAVVAGQPHPAAAAAAVYEVGQVVSNPISRCPPGCIDLGLIAQVLGLPWPCFCQVWLLGDLVEQLSKVVGQLWVAVTGALLLFAATSWLFGYVAAQGAAAACAAQQQAAGLITSGRDEQEALADGA